MELKSDAGHVPIELVSDVRLGRATTSPTKHETIASSFTPSVNVRLSSGCQIWEKKSENVPKDMVNVYYLVKMIGKELQAPFTRPKYRLHIYMTIGTLQDEQSIANMLYGLFIWLDLIFYKETTC